MLGSLVFLALCGNLLAGGCRTPLDPWDRLQHAPGAQLVTISDTLFPEADSYIRLPQPNSNWGADTALQLGGGGKSRVLVRFDSTALRAVVGAGTLDSAWLEFTIQAGPSGWGVNERTVDLHRLLKSWAELGATWNCAVDANTANSVADCPTEGWDMTNNGNGTYHAVRTDRVTVNNGQTGVIRLNVTADVQGYLAGSFLSRGWVFRKTSESQGGEALVFSRESGSQPRLVIRVTTNAVPAQAPDTLPAWVFADSNISLGSTAISGPFVKHVILVRFKASATQAERQAAVDAVNGVVVGGLPHPLGDGYYVIQVPDPGDGSSLLAAGAQLELLPYIWTAGIEVFVGPNYRRPSDGPGWTAWRTSPALADGQNWALEQIGAPLAWGCTTGDSLTARVAVVDVGFQNLQEVMRNAQLVHGSFSPFMGGAHGTGVASVIAAVGNNDSLMTGLMWQAKLRLYDYGPRATWDTATSGPLFAVVDQVVQAALDGAKVVNISTGIRGWAPRPSLGNARDVARVTPVAKRLAASLSELRLAGFEPLVVLSAGNDTVDAYWNGFPAAKDPTNQHQIVVVGASTIQKTPWDSSNYGPLVDVYAPGEQVYVLDGDEVMRPGSGTSIAAPHVTGIAGLLLSMDSTLDARTLKQLIGDGAVRGGVVIGSHYLANAYGSLTLAAETSGRPLCGNDVWVSNGVLKTRRGSTTETIAVLNDSAGLVNARHGGRRVDVFADNAVTLLRGFAYQPTSRTWAEVTDPWADPDTLPGGTYLGSLWVSHDADSSVSTAPAAAGFDVIINTGSVAATVGTIPATGSVNTVPDCRQQERPDSSTTYVCLASIDVGTTVRRWPRPAFSPRGDRVLVAVNQETETIAIDQTWLPCPGTDSVGTPPAPRFLCKGYSGVRTTTGFDLWEIPLQTGQSPGSPHQLQTGSGGPATWWLSVSEDGARLVLGTGTEHVNWRADPATGWSPTSTTTYPDCQVLFLDAGLGYLNSDPSPEACNTPFESAGTIAPLRRPAASRHAPNRAGPASRPLLRQGRQ